MITEEWRPVPLGFEGFYQVSNFGRIRSVDRVRAGRYGPQRCDGKILRPRVNRVGYLQVNLYRDGQSQTLSLHRLVARAFVPNPNLLPMVNHIDGVKTNAAASNLEWTNDRLNKQHAIKTGLITRFKKLLTSEEVNEIRRLAGTMSQAKIAEQYGTTQTNVSLIQLRRTHGGKDSHLTAHQ